MFKYRRNGSVDIVTRLSLETGGIGVHFQVAATYTYFLKNLGCF
jgi:hypothetical protein